MLNHPGSSRSVFEGSAAAGSTYEIFEQVAVDLPESGGLRHLGQVIHAELKAELFQVLNDKGKEHNSANGSSFWSDVLQESNEIPGITFRTLFSWWCNNQRIHLYTHQVAPL